MALVAGSMLGIGIFLMPGQVAVQVSSPWLFLAVWLAGGVTAASGALCLAELGAMRPHSGGDYEFLHVAWGRGLAFAAGWLQLLVIFPGGLASVAVATADYQLPVVLGDWAASELTIAGAAIPMPPLTAAALIVALTVVNHLGVRIAGWIQVTVTVVPIAALLALCVVAFAAGDLAGALADRPAAPLTLGLSPAAGLGQAYLKVYFAYSGWNAALFVAGEVKDPARNLPRALVGGTAAVTALYLLLCLGFLAVFGFEGLREVGEAGTETAVKLFGSAAAFGMALMIALAMLGTLNGTILIGSRIAYAMARRGDCIGAAGRLHPRWGTPHVALWLQAAIALALVFGPFDLERLIDYTSSAMLITGTLTVLALLVLRRTQPDVPRPYRATLHPLPLVAYALSSVVVLALVVADRNPSALVALGWFAVALVLAVVMGRRRRGRGGGGPISPNGGSTRSPS